jgi:hypothetical protein
MIAQEKLINLAGVVALWVYLLNVYNTMNMYYTVLLIIN